MRYEMRILIRRPIEEVWAFMADLFNLPRLRGMTLVARQTSPGPIGLGATVQVRSSIVGVETAWSGEITEWNPPHAMALSVVTGPGLRSGLVRQTFEAAADGTNVSRTIDLEMAPLAKLGWIFVGPFVKRRWDASTRNLKKLIEASPANR